MLQVQDVDNLSLEFLKQICLAMHLRRREFLIHILALRIVNTGKPVSETTYRQELEQAQQEIGHLAQEIENIVLESTDILNDVLCKCPQTSDKQTPVMRWGECLCEGSQELTCITSTIDSGPSDEAESAEKDPKQRGDSYAFLQRLASLQQQLRTLQAKMFLCHEDAQRVGDGMCQYWKIGNNDEARINIFA